MEVLRPILPREQPTVTVAFGLGMEPDVRWISSHY